jgi:Fe-S cluster biosynthesis and repair protein YggX
MMSKIFCKKLKKEADALVFQPIPGPLGEKIMSEISQEAWQMWVGQQTILINEYRLVLTDPKARQFLRQEMEKFLFSEE